VGPAVREPETGPFLRRMRLSDLRAVMDLDARSLPKPWSEGIWRSELESPFGLYLVLEEGGRIAGQIGIRNIVDELHITTVAVHPEHRGRGHARVLIHAAVSAYPDASLVHLEVRPTNDVAITLYRSLGFRETGRRPRYYGDEDALLMTLHLRADRP
jgi:[ribosomal protein S18]-alanine N-acetyltransferase